MPFAKRVVFLAFALLVASCNDPEDEPCSTCTTDTLLRQAKEDVAAGNFARAIEKCTKVVEAEPENVDGHFCLLIGHVGEMTNGVNNVLKAIGSQLPTSDPALAPAKYLAAVDAKPIVSGYVENFEDDMIAVDREVQFLAGRPDVAYQINRFPVHLEFQKIAAWLNGYSGEYLPGELLLDLGGTWDMSEVLILGSAFNAALAAIDYALAHDMEIRRIPAGTSLTSVIAELLVDNPSFLAFDPSESSDRLEGTELEKGFRKDLIATLSYLAGRKDVFEEGVAANVGLQEAIRASAASGVTDPVVKWIDEDGDGNPEAVDAKFLSDMIDQLTGVYVPRFPIPLAGDTFDAFYALVDNLRENAENGGAAVHVQEFLELLRNDVGAFLIIAPGYKPVPDLVALDLHPFLEETPAVRDLFPYFFASGDTFNLAYELEWGEVWSVSPDPGVTTGWGDVVDMGTRYYDVAWGGWRSKNSMGHFELGGVAEVLDEPGLVLSDDGVSPAGYAQTLVYLGLQSPSFGGLLHVNLESLGGSSGMAKANHGTVNEALGRLFKYYCFNLGDSQYGWDFFFTFHTDCPDGSEN